MAEAIGSTGTPVWIDRNGVPKPGDQKLITGEKFFTTSWRYAEYDANASGHIKAGTCWKDLPSTDIRKKCFSIGSAVSVSGYNYNGNKITNSVKPLIYTVQNDSLVHITLGEFTGTGGGDMITMYMCVFNHDGSDAKWIRVSRFTEKFGNADEVMCCQFMCKAGTKFRFVFYNGTIKHITNGSNTVGRYCYQPMSADAEAYAYLWNSSTRTAKKGFTGGIDVTEFVLTGTNVTTGEVEEPSSDPESGGEVPGGGDAPVPVVIPTTDIGHDNTDDIQTVLVKNSTIVVPTHNSGSDTKPVYVKNGAIVPCDLPKTSQILGTDANGALVKKSLTVTTDTWTFEALDGTIVNKNLVTGVTVSNA